MTLLFDQNLSPRPVDRLADLHPNADHVRELAPATDREVWKYAGRHGFAFVTKDSDSNDTVVTRGTPPNVVWLRLGNCTTDAIQQALCAHDHQLRPLADDPDVGLIEIDDGRTG